MQTIDTTSRITRALRAPLPTGRRSAVLLWIALLLGGSGAATGVASAQPYLGGLGDYNVNVHDADFQSLPSVPSCCPRFNEGEGRGFTLGLLYEWGINRRWVFTARATYTREDGTLISTERTTVSVNGEATPAAFEHRLETVLSSAAIEPLFGWRPFRGTFGGLLIRGGFRAGFSTRGIYSQREQLVEPTDVGAFDRSGNRIRNERSGEIPLASAFRASLLGGLSWEVLLARDSSVVLEPEFLYSYGLTPIVRDLDWFVHQVRVGAALKFMVDVDDEPEAETQVAAPTPRPVVSADTPEIRGKMDGCDAVEVRPLLPYVFFDMNSSVIPNRFVGSQPAMDRPVKGLVNLNDDLLDSYHAILDTIAERMKVTPTNIELVGCNSDRGPERGRKTLSMRRARAVRDYLVERGVSPDLIAVSVRNLPSMPSPPDDTLGMQENRRVEIVAPWEIIRPVVVRQTPSTAAFPGVRFLPALVPAGQTVRNWRLTAVQQGRTVFTDEGDGPTLPGELRWQPSGDLNRTAPVQYWLDVTSSSGQSARSNVMQLGVGDDGRPCTMVRSSLIMFDFDKSTLGAYDRGILETYIRPALRGGSTVAVAGYTDEMGEEGHNLELSQSRARSVVDELAVPASADGYGESAWTSRSQTPEERFYRRIVVTEVKNQEP